MRMVGYIPAVGSNSSQIETRWTLWRSSLGMARVLNSGELLPLTLPLQTTENRTILALLQARSQTPRPGWTVSIIRVSQAYASLSLVQCSYHRLRFRLARHDRILCPCFQDWYLPNHPTRQGFCLGPTTSSGCPFFRPRATPQELRTCSYAYCTRLRT
jgi:hypothetical protein